MGEEFQEEVLPVGLRLDGLDGKDPGMIISFGKFGLGNSLSLFIERLPVVLEPTGEIHLDAIQYFIGYNGRGGDVEHPALKPFVKIEAQHNFVR